MKQRVTSHQLLVAITSGVLFALVAAVTALAARPVNQDFLALITTQNNVYPEVALRIDGRPISGQFLDAAVERIMNDSVLRGAPVSRGEAEKTAVDHLVRRAALVREATKRGFNASDDEITAYLSQQIALKQADPDPATANAIEAANGDLTDQDYLNDQAVRAGIAEQIIADKLLASVSADNPDFDVDGFISGLTDNVTVQDFVNR